MITRMDITKVDTKQRWAKLSNVWLRCGASTPLMAEAISAFMPAKCAR